MVKRVRLTSKTSKAAKQAPKAKAKRARIEDKPKRVRIQENPKPKRVRIAEAKELERVRLKKTRESASSKADYEVGHGKPPKHSQFSKGDGRPRPGRPKGSKNLDTLLMEAARMKTSAIIDGKKRKISLVQATTMRLALRAAAGEPKASTEFLDWVDKIERRAEAARPSEYPFSDLDKSVIRETYKRLRPYDERGND